MRAALQEREDLITAAAAASLDEAIEHGASWVAKLGKPERVRVTASSGVDWRCASPCTATALIAESPCPSAHRTEWPPAAGS